MGHRRRVFRRVRGRRAGQHADRPARRSSDHQPLPRPAAVSPVPGRDQLAVGLQRDVGGAHRGVLRISDLAVDPPAQRTLAARRRHRRVVRGALDPLANWATFAVFDSRVAHFPLSWPYFNISPLLEPTLSFLGGYASYYVLTGLGLLSLHRRIIEPRIRHHSFLDGTGSSRCSSPVSLRDFHSTRSCSSCGSRSACSSTPRRQARCCTSVIDTCPCSW